MAVPFALPSEEETGVYGPQLEQLMLELYSALQQVIRSRNNQHPSRNHRLPRRPGDGMSPRDYPMVLVDSDLAGLPLPDLVLSAVEQMPPETPQVTVSAPSSPTRDAAFQFPESTTENHTDSLAPIPSPRPRPRRRRLTSECGTGTIPKKGPFDGPFEGPFEGTSSGCHRAACCRHFAEAFNDSRWANVGANLRSIADDFHACKNNGTGIGKTRMSTMNPEFPNPRSNASPSDGILSYLMPAHFRETLWTTVAIYLGWRLVSRLR